MNIIKGIKAFGLGMLFSLCRFIIQPRKNLWLFGSDKGEKFAQNSKYMFEYILNNHPEIDAYWVTQNPTIYTEMKRNGLPVLKNFSFKGAYYSHISELKIMSTWFNDIIYTYPSQKVAYLMHGMPIKKIYYDDVRSRVSTNIAVRLKSYLSKRFLYNYKLDYSCFTPVTSNFFKQIITKAMKNNNVFVTGQPRTDAFLHLDNETIRKKYGINDKAFVITYMPTHRSYGAGEPSPHLFKDNEAAIDFFKENNIVVVWKQHINMLKKYKKEKSDTCFMELSFDYLIDPQELLFVSDVLITDWSSCFVDYLLLRRPILFYHYDNYEKDDNDLYYGTELLSKVGRISKTEDILLNDIKDAFLKKVNINDSKWNIFNEFYDDKSCERCFYQIRSLLDNCIS